MAEGNDKSETFEKLVSSISETERNVLLEKMHALAGDPETQEFSSGDREPLNEYVSFEEKIKDESFFYRFFLWLRSLFSNSTKEEVYNEDQILALYKKVNHSFPELVDYKNGCLLGMFHQKLSELKTAVGFFKPYLEFAYESPGAFYVFLGSIICPELTQEMDSQVDPGQLPLTREVTGELRSSLIRKMNQILKDMPQHRRSYIYSCVSVVEWFYQLSKLPFDRFCSSFTQGVTGEFCCRFDVVANEFNSFAKILCNGGAVPEEAVTSLFLFSADKFIPLDSEATDKDGRMREFMDKATSNISTVHMFVKTVPLRQIGKIVFHNAQWQPPNFTGAEDWFVKYKDHWKKLFDEKWKLWLLDKKKVTVSSKLSEVFGLDDFPLLPNRPWTQLWGSVSFHFEYTAGFIFWFMEKRYNELIQPLKTLLLEGAFSNKDNRQEFADTVNDLMQIYTKVVKLGEDLSSLGQIGLVFEKIAANHLRTLQAQSKIDSTMLNFEAEIQNIKNMFCDNCRSIKRVVGAVLGDRSDTRYDGISNINVIRGMNNQVFKDRLEKSKTAFECALEMLKELEAIDIPEHKPE